MAMTPALWSINALATELNIDRRTIAKRLVGIPPAGKVGVHNAWRLAAVVPAILKEPARGSGTKPLPRGVGEELGLPMTAGGRPIDEALALGLTCFAERAPARIAVISANLGVPAPLARELFRAAAVSLVMLTDEIAAEAGITWRCDDHHATPLEPNWQRLAESTGVS